MRYQKGPGFALLNRFKGMFCAALAGLLLVACGGSSSASAPVADITGSWTATFPDGYESQYVFQRDGTGTETDQGTDTPFSYQVLDDQHLLFVDGDLQLLYQFDITDRAAGAMTMHYLHPFCGNWHLFTEDGALDADFTFSADGTAREKGRLSDFSYEADSQTLTLTHGGETHRYTYYITDTTPNKARLVEETP